MVKQKKAVPEVRDIGGIMRENDRLREIAAELKSILDETGAPVWVNDGPGVRNLTLAERLGWLVARVMVRKESDSAAA